MRPLTYVIALGVESGGTEGTRPLQFKSFEGTSPRNLGTFTFFQCRKKVLNGILSNHVVEIQGEYYIWVGGMGSITPSPPP